MKFKTEPFAHQLDVFERTKDLPGFAIFWEMGCGKTWVAINTAAWMFESGNIDGLLVVAPNGVHRNWVTDELPAHCPIPYSAHVYSAAKAGTARHQEQVKAITAAEGLAVLTIPYTSFTTARAKDAAWKFLRRRRCLYVLDESHFIKTPKAKRTISILASGKYAAFRRILTGTPYLNSPFDLWPQMKFLDPEFWKDRGFPELSVFKAHFSVTEEVERKDGRKFPQVVAYRNEDQLRALLEPFRSRLTKEQALPNLPERAYVRVPVELNADQRKLYEAVASEFLTEFESYERARSLRGDPALLPPPPDALTTLLRLQQVTCGYYPSDSDELVPVGGENPRLRQAVEICDGTSGPVIVWARFRQDIDMLVEALGPGRAVRYDGAASEDQRIEALRRFRAREAQVLVMNPQAGGTGLTLNEAATAVYYSNSFSLGDRLQSEARNHRSGQKNAVTYYDLIAAGTVDERIVRALRDKIEMAATVNGDELRTWLLT